MAACVPGPLEAEDRHLERLCARAAGLGEGLIEGLRRRLGDYELVKEVRGKGMMLAIEFGPPRA